MKRELFIHFSFWLFFFVLISVFRNLISLLAWGFWIGGILGIFLPDIDHFIYVYFVKPQELTSQRVNYLVANGGLVKSISLLYKTRNERKNLIFHSILFQIIFFILTFLIATSSGSLFGRGIVFSFSLHLIVDQLIDLENMGNLDNWFANLPFRLDLKQSKVFIGAVGILLLIMGVWV